MEASRQRFPNSENSDFFNFYSIVFKLTVFLYIIYMKEKREIIVEPMTTPSFQSDSKNEQSVPLFAYELLRDILIPEMLGKDTNEISYWVGKHIARTFPLLSMEEVASFFNEAAWGQLELIEQNKKEMKLELSGEIVERRLHMQADPSFRLEAGFIAQQIQSQKNIVTEAYEEVAKKKKKVSITVRWDGKDQV